MVLIDGLASEQPLFKNEKKIFEIGEAAKLRNFAPTPLAHENIDGGGEVGTCAKK